MKFLRVCLFVLPLLLVVVEVCYGGDLNLELIATMTGENDGDRFGRRVAGLGDINNDGYDDVAVRGGGKVHVFLGSSDFDSIADIFLNDGIGIACAGDVNGDSISDFIIGASACKSDSGRACLYFGGTEVDTIPDLIFVELVGPLGSYGFHVASAGDVDNDGFDDVIVSDANDGLVYLYLGGENMDTVADAIFSEGEGVDLFGASISSAGDINGDGYDDIIIGRHNYPLFSVYLYLGGSPLDTIADYVLNGGEVASGDVNGDGYSDVITEGGARIYFGGITMDTIPDIVITEFSGRASTGYFNKDNYADIITGNGYSHGGLGSARVFLGGSPMDSTSDWGVVGQYGGALGASVSSAGDVNGDSVDDVIIGEPEYFFGSNRGRAYVFAGDTIPPGVEDWNHPYRLPREFKLYQNYPNPFNAATTIRYRLSAISYQLSAVSLKIYNLLGEEVKTLVNRRQRAGYYSVTWEGDDDNGKRLSSGIYLYQLRCGSYSATRKLLYLK